MMVTSHLGITGEGWDRTDLEQAISARRCACWGVDRIHPSELLCKVSHVQFALQLWFERACHFLLCKVSPVESLLGHKADGTHGWIKKTWQGKRDIGGKMQFTLCRTLKKVCALMSSAPLGPEPSLLCGSLTNNFFSRSWAVDPIMEGKGGSQRKIRLSEDWWKRWRRLKA